MRMTMMNMKMVTMKMIMTRKPLLFHSGVHPSPPASPLILPLSLLLTVNADADHHDGDHDEYTDDDDLPLNEVLGLC